MKSILKYSKENAEEFFKKIDKLRKKDKFLASIKALNSIPKEERDYRICYVLARAYQDLAIIGEDYKETEHKLKIEMLEQSLMILDSIKEEGKDKAE